MLYALGSKLFTTSSTALSYQNFWTKSILELLTSQLMLSPKAQYKGRKTNKHLKIMEHLNIKW